MRKIVATVAIALSLLAVGATSARADTPGCVSRTEFNSIRLGATRARVTAVFDIPGRVTGQGGSGGYAFEFREYRPCSGRPYSYVSVDFYKEPGRIFTVDGKYAFWG